MGLGIQLDLSRDDVEFHRELARGAHVFHRGSDHDIRITSNGEYDCVFIDGELMAHGDDLTPQEVLAVVAEYLSLNWTVAYGLEGFTDGTN